MKISNFNVVGVRAKDIKFETVNPNFAENIAIELDINSQYSVAKDTNRNAKVEMTIKIFPTVENAPFRIEVVMEGIFEWNEELNERELKLFLEVNGNAVLFSYARPIISQITTFAGFSPIVLPLANFYVNEKDSL